MSPLDSFLSSVLDNAIAELQKKRCDVYTFSFCHDRERDAVAVYADSEASSRRVTLALNRASMKRFAKAVKKGDLEEALMWQATASRNLSLGDFCWKNLARRPLGAHKRAAKLHEGMLRALLQHVPKVAALSSDRELLLFTCSTPDEDVGLVWTADAAASGTDKRKPLRTVRAQARQLM